MQRTGVFALVLVVFLVCVSIGGSGQTLSFDFKRYLLGPQSTLEVFVESIDISSGTVQFNGGDSRCPTIPFTWSWGDGSISEEFFPPIHTYADKDRNYIVRVTAHYSDGSEDSAEVVVRFVSPSISPIELSPNIGVHIPDHMISLGAHYYGPPNWLTYFDDTFFSTVPRSTIEYVLSVAATVEMDFVNDNVYLFNGMFEQYMFRDASFGGAYSLWYTDPVTFGAGDGYLAGSIGYSSLFHEMGHNFTLNSPADFYYGGKTDGQGSTIFSESMGQIFQHAAGYEIVNHHQFYGLSDDLMEEIKEEVIKTIKYVREQYEDYLNAGKSFTSWNDPTTQDDETMPTFMTIAYKFCEHAENSGYGYRAPLKRMMRLLQGFNQDWADRYDPLGNSPAGELFRSTLMVSALSYAFAEDLRDEFRQLNFPVSDEIYAELLETVPAAQVRQSVSGPMILSFNDAPDITAVTINLEQCTGSGSITVTRQANSPMVPSFSGPVPAHISQYRWIVDATGISDISADIRFAIDQIPAGISNPSTVTVYARPVEGTGAFVALPTTYEASYQELVVTVTGFSEYIFGSDENPLPVQITHFGCSMINGNQVRLEWTTAGEVNNYGFYVQRRRTGRSTFCELPDNFIPGHGTTLLPQRYSYIDNDVTVGEWLYRLKQVDLDGTTHFTEPVSVSVLADVVESAPRQFALFQNYPNPFNSETEARFSVDQRFHAVLTLYNALGQEVARVFDDLAEPGRYYRVKLDGSNLAGGVYLCRLQSGGKNDVKKVLLLK